MIYGSVHFNGVLSKELKLLGTLISGLFSLHVNILAPSKTDIGIKLNNAKSMLKITANEKTGKKFERNVESMVRLIFTNGASLVYVLSIAYFFIKVDNSQLRAPSGLALPYHLRALLSLLERLL